MIVQALLDLISGLLKTLFGWINLPSLPVGVEDIINTTFSYMESGFGMVALFIDFNLVKILLPLVIVIVNFDKAYHLVMFVLRKIPFLGIK